MPNHYALVMMSVFDDDGHNALEDLGRDNLTWVGTLDRVLDSSRYPSWKDDVGRWQWNRLMTGHRFYLVHSTRDVMYARWRAGLAWYAIQLCGLLTPFEGPAYLLTGEAEPATFDGVRLLTLSTYEQLNPIKLPLYTTMPEYTAAHPPELSDPWFDRWRGASQPTRASKCGSARFQPRAATRPP